MIVRLSHLTEPLTNHRRSPHLEMSYEFDSSVMEPPIGKDLVSTTSKSVSTQCSVNFN